MFCNGGCALLPARAVQQQFLESPAGRFLVLHPAAYQELVARLPQVAGAAQQALSRNATRPTGLSRSARAAASGRTRMEGEEAATSLKSAEPGADLAEQPLLLDQALHQLVSCAVMASQSLASFKDWMDQQDVQF